jgi:GH18 family chitinase
VKVLASIGGGSHNPYYAKLLSDSGRSFFIERLVKLSIDHKLDGIDIDLENDAIDSNYTPFVISLSLKLRLNNKLMTAAFATWNANLISDSALEKFDFINIMSYDETGPWRPERAGQHSPFSKAENDIRNWRETRHLPKEKINLGLPFYAYCFNTKYGASMSFESIVKTFPGSQVKDSIVPEGGGLIYYNGLPTIRKKTELAFANTGGVMIWQLLQDSPGEHSLLSAIDETHRSEK